MRVNMDELIRNAPKVNDINGLNKTIHWTFGIPVTLAPKSLCDPLSTELNRKFGKKGQSFALFVEKVNEQGE